MPGMNVRWCKTELDNDGPRKRFRRALMRALAEFRHHKRKTASIFTPYWKSDYIDWLLYEGTLNPCGAKVESITPDTVTFVANCSGVSCEGICLDVTFEIPTSQFTRAELKQMVHDFEWFPAKEGKHGGLDYGPFDNPQHITECEWWYDDSYDDNAPEN